MAKMPGSAIRAGEYFFTGRIAPMAGAVRRRGLIAFDIAGSVPAGATINSVSLMLNMSRTTSGPQNVGLHQVLSDWGEGTSAAPGQEGSDTGRCHLATHVLRHQFLESTWR